MPDFHHVFSPSSAARHLKCIGYMLPKVPNHAGDAAKIGTACHKLLEYAQAGIDPKMMVGQVITDDKLDNGQGIPVDEEMVKAVNYFNDTVRGLMLELGISPNNCRSESHLVHPLTAIEGKDPSQIESYLFGGTTDFFAWSEDTLLVADLKYGLEPVPASSPQLTEYAILAMANMPPEAAERIKRVVQVIIQPRLTYGELMDRYELSEGELVQTWHTLWQQMELYKQNEKLPSPDMRVFVTGGHCKRCPKINTCPAITREMTETVQVSEAMAKLPDGLDADMSVDALTYWLDRAETIREFLKALEKRAWLLAQSGTQIPGKKLVYSFGHRKWKVDPVIKGRTRNGVKSPDRIAEGDELVQKTVAMLRKKFGVTKDQATNTEVKSPAQFETLLKKMEKYDKAAKEAVMQITERSIRGVRLVDENAPGEPVDASLDVTFADALKYAEEQ